MYSMNLLNHATFCIAYVYHRTCCQAEKVLFERYDTVVLLCIYFLIETTVIYYTVLKHNVIHQNKVSIVDISLATTVFVLS